MTRSQPDSGPMPSSESAAANTPHGAHFAPLMQALQAHVPSQEDLLAEARAQTEQQAHRARIRTAVAGTALAVLAGVVWLDPVWHSETVHVAIGQQEQRTLPDGSTVHINTGSRLVIERRLRSRSFRLEHGEAAFQVASDDWRPFIVRSGALRVRDLSTAFAVRQDESGQSVTVTEGAVEVATKHAQGGYDQAITLTQGQRLRIAAVGHEAGRAATSAAHSWPPRVENIAVQRASAWQTGRLVFDDVPLREAVSEINRYLPGTLTVAEDGAASLRLSGVYDIDALPQLLLALPRVLNVSLQPQPDGSRRIEMARSPSRK